MRVPIPQKKPTMGNEIDGQADQISGGRGAAELKSDRW